MRPAPYIFGGLALLLLVTACSRAAPGTPGPAVPSSQAAPAPQPIATGQPAVDNVQANLANVDNITQDLNFSDLDSLNNDLNFG